MWSIILKEKKEDMLESLEDFQCFLMHVSTIGNQRRYSIRLSIPVFIGASCMKDTLLELSCIVQTCKMFS